MPLDKNRIYFLVPYPLGYAPGQRFRFEHYLKLLENYNFDIDFGFFYSPATFNILYKKGHIIKKTLGIIFGFLNRILHVAKSAKYDYIFVYRELAPIGPPIFEWIIVKLLRKKIIYDFDDAIWLEDPDENGTLLAMLKWKSKVDLICKWSYKITVGNQFLAKYASQFNHKVKIIPTVVDTEIYHNPRMYKKNIDTKVIIGWTGSHSTLTYLQNLIPILRKLYNEIPFTLKIISNKKPNFNFPDLQYVEWNKETELEDLYQMDIGIMPLTNDLWSEGKCGFKAIQYMSLEIPSVASSVGVNNIIIRSGSNGFIATSEEDWLLYLKILINNKNTRIKFGQEARNFITKHYSVESTSNDFLQLFA